MGILEHADRIHQQLNQLQLESDHAVNEFQAFLFFFLRKSKQLSGTLFQVSMSVPLIPISPRASVTCCEGWAEVIGGHVSVNHLLDDAQSENVG